MSTPETYKMTITVLSYKDVVDKFQKKNNLTRKEVKERLAGQLQMMAWADIYPEMQNYLDWEISEVGKRYIAEQEAKESEE